MFNFIKKYKIEIILGIVISAYIIIFSYFSIHRLYVLNSHYYDLGIMNQVVYNTSRGWFLEMSNLEFGNNISRFAIHFDPILALFAPLYWFYPRSEVLLIVQTLILASGALAVFFISKKITKNKLLSLIFFFSFLCYFPVQRANLYEFHAVVLATSLFLWAIYFSLIKKIVPTLIMIILSLLTKEHAGLVAIFFGIYLFIFNKEKKLGLIISLLGGIFFITSFFIIIPYFRQGTHFALQYYNFDGNLLTFFKTIFNSENLDYLIRIITPVFPYIFFSPIEFLISLPEILINILSTNGNMRSYYFHYSSLIVPFAYFSMIKSVIKIRKTNWSKFALVIFIILNIYSVYKYSLVPLFFVKYPYDVKLIDQKKLKEINKWQINLQNDQIKVSTTPKLAPFFTSRRYFYNYDATYRYANISKNEILKTINNYNQADYVIINKEEIGDINKDNIQTIFYKYLSGNNKFIIVSNKDGIEVFKKL